MNQKIPVVVDELRQNIHNFLILLHEEFTQSEYIKALNALIDARDMSLTLNKELWDRAANEDDEANKVKRKLKIFGRNQYHSLVDSMNALSIVCHNKDGKYVFLGDVSTKVILELKNDFLNSYNVVKIQHHATDKYYTTKMPTGTNYIVSNGGYDYRKVSQRIIKMIEIQSNDILPKRIYCTNAHENPKKHCGYYKKYNICSPVCIKMDREREIPC